MQTEDTPIAPATQRHRILLAEDDDELADLVADLLVVEGYDVETVRTGSGLLSALSSPESLSRYAAVVSDNRMPGLSAIDVLALVDPDERPPVILITAFPSPQVQRFARELGAAALLSKPFDLESVRTLVAWAIQRRRSEQLPV